MKKQTTLTLLTCACISASPSFAREAPTSSDPSAPPLAARRGLISRRPIKKVARARGEAIREYLRQLKVKDVAVYNMAKGTTWLAKAFNTEDAEVKAVFAGEKRAPRAGTRLEIDAFRDYGAPSLAVIVVENHHG